MFVEYIMQIIFQKKEKNEKIVKKKIEKEDKSRRDIQNIKPKINK